MMIGATVQGRAHISRQENPSAGHRGINIGGVTQSNSTNAGPISTDQNSHDQVAIHIEKVVRSMPALRSEYCCMYRVPERFREGNEDFYKPRVVSIGFFHNGESQQIVNQKFRYVDAFFNRNRLNLDHFVGLVRGWEARARSYYVVPIGLSSDVFVLRMLVDAIFVLELMLRHHFPQYIDTSDWIYRKPNFIPDIYHDMMLIENQLPFFVLKGLYEQMTSTLSEGNDHQLSFVNLTHEFFKQLAKVDECPHHASLHGVKHFVDFLRCYYLPLRSKEDNTKYSDHEIPPSVTALEEAGVKLETTRSSTATSLLDIEFNNGRLQIPNLVVDDWTETLFRNLIAFEQCHDTEKYISQFVFLMVSMIRTSKDADLLIDRGIISTLLGSGKDVSILFSQISKDVGFGRPFYYSSICQRLNAYCKIPWNSWKATLKRDYFNTPWKIASTVAAIILLLLTLAQTICSILSL